MRNENIENEITVIKSMIKKSKQKIENYNFVLSKEIYANKTLVKNITDEGNLVKNYNNKIEELYSDYAGNKEKVKIHHQQREKLQIYEDLISSNNIILESLVEEQRIYYYSLLRQGYDCRSKGLRWIVLKLKFLNSELQANHFPKYLSQKNIEFLIKLSEKEYIKEILNIRLKELKRKIKTDIFDEIKEKEKVKKENILRKRNENKRSRYIQHSISSEDSLIKTISSGKEVAKKESKLVLKNELQKIENNENNSKFSRFNRNKNNELVLPTLTTSNSNFNSVNNKTGNKNNKNTNLLTNNQSANSTNVSFSNKEIKKKKEKKYNPFFSPIIYNSNNKAFNSNNKVESLMKKKPQFTHIMEKEKEIKSELDPTSSFKLSKINKHHTTQLKFKSCRSNWKIKKDDKNKDKDDDLFENKNSTNFNTHLLTKDVVLNKEDEFIPRYEDTNLIEKDYIKTVTKKLMQNIKQHEKENEEKKQFKNQIIISQNPYNGKLQEVKDWTLLDKESKNKDNNIEIANKMIHSTIKQTINSKNKKIIKEVSKRENQDITSEVIKNKANQFYTLMQLRFLIQKYTTEIDCFLREYITIFKRQNEYMIQSPFQKKRIEYELIHSSLFGNNMELNFYYDDNNNDKKFIKSRKNRKINK